VAIATAMMDDAFHIIDKDNDDILLVASPEAEERAAPDMSATGPCVDGSGLARRIFTLRRWSERPCVRPVCAVHVTAGHNPSADQVPIKSRHSEMPWPVWVVLIAGSTGAALSAVRPSNRYVTPAYPA